MNLATRTRLWSLGHRPTEDPAKLRRQARRLTVAAARMATAAEMIEADRA